jgi:hypothetical protein
MSTKESPRSVGDLFPKNAQSGQAIILIAVMMIGLIGALGLSIDGGGLFFLRRDTQNAVDAALLAAAYAQCAQDPAEAAAMTETEKDALVVEAALDAAERNGFVDTDPAVNLTNRVDVQVNRGPTSGPKQGDTDYVEVIIRANKPSYFIQIVWGGQLSATSRGVSYCSAARSTNPGAGMMAFGDCNGANSNVELDWSGSNFTVDSGGIMSAARIDVGGNSAHTGENAITGGVSAVGTIDIDPSDYVLNPSNPPYVEGIDPSLAVDPLDLHVSDFTATGRIGRNIPNAYLHVYNVPNLNIGSLPQPIEGVYVNTHPTGGIDIGGATWSETPGASFVSYGPIDMQGQAGADYHYYSGLNSTDEGAEGILLFSELDDECGTNNASQGISVRGRGGDDCDQGNGGDCTIMTGIIYAPHSEINWSAARMNVLGAILGYTIDGSGADFHFAYIPDLFPPRPPMLEIAE